MVVHNKMLQVEEQVASLVKALGNQLEGSMAGELEKKVEVI